MHTRAAMIRASFTLFFFFPLVSLTAVACSAQSEQGPATSQAPSEAEPAQQGTSEAEGQDADLPVSPFCDHVNAKGFGRGFIDFLHPAPSADYVAQLTALHPQAYAGQDDEFRTAGEIGVLCSGANDVASCKTAYDAIPTVTAPSRTCFTRGDEVGCLDAKAQAMAFLGEVHSVEEAMFIASYDGYETACSDQRVIARGKELANHTFRLALARSTGCNTSDRVIIDVARDGTIALRKSWTTDFAFGCW